MLAHGGVRRESRPTPEPRVRWASCFAPRIRHDRAWLSFRPAAVLFFLSPATGVIHTCDSSCDSYLRFILAQLDFLRFNCWPTLCFFSSLPLAFPSPSPLTPTYVTHGPPSLPATPHHHHTRILTTPPPQDANAAGAMEEIQGLQARQAARPHLARQDH
jgi:hypothetical protein